MTKELLDIEASFTTHWTRAGKVIPSMALAISQVAIVLAILEEGADTDQQREAYAKIRIGLLDGIQDVAEILDGLRDDVIDTLEQGRV